jgi:hypothetical protein
MEGHAVLRALALKVECFDLTVPPVRTYNNLAHGWAGLPIEVRAAAT